MDNHGTKYNVLFLGSSNAARSIMAEAILNREGSNRFQVYSAGIAAADRLDPNAAHLLERMNFDTAALHPKQWNEYAGKDAPSFDFIFTLCDAATLLPRSIWQGNPAIAHWDVADPALAQGNESEIQLAYAEAFRILSAHIGIFVNLPQRSLDRLGQLVLIDDQKPEMRIAAGGHR